MADILTEISGPRTVTFSAGFGRWSGNDIIIAAWQPTIPILFGKHRELRLWVDRRHGQARDPTCRHPLVRRSGTM
jgi:hypothetical protein